MKQNFNFSNLQWMKNKCQILLYFQPHPTCNKNIIKHLSSFCVGIRYFLRSYVVASACQLFIIH